MCSHAVEAECTYFSKLAANSHAVEPVHIGGEEQVCITAIIFLEAK